MLYYYRKDRWSLINDHLFNDYSNLGWFWTNDGYDWSLDLWSPFVTFFAGFLQTKSMEKPADDSK